MAPIPSFEIDLARCFKGEQQLVTWNIVYRALCDPETASKSEALQSFLTAEENIGPLSRPWKPFPDASSQEKARFEAKTAPISVTPTQGGHYDLEEIKRDSLWLSAQAQISEYAALQLVVEEWQGRPAAQLLSGLTEEEALSVQEAAGIANLGASIFVPNSSILTTPFAQKNTKIDAEHQRRLRIIDVYHTTCASILRVSQLLVSWGSAVSLRSQTIYGVNYGTIGAPWLEQLGQDIATRQTGSARGTTSAKALEKCLGALQRRCDNLGAYSWDVDESILEPASERWVVAQTTELLHILHLALVHVDLVTRGYVPAASIEDWLQTFASQGFFRDFTAVTPRQEPLVPVIQLLTSLVALSLLKVDQAIDELSSDSYRNWDNSTYILNTVVVKNITLMLAAATELGPSPATPAIFAWAMITDRLKNIAGRDEQERERLLESAHGSNDASNNPSPLEQAALVLSNPDLEVAEIFGDNVPSKTLANAGAEAGVLEIVNSFVETGLPAFGTPVDEITRDRVRLLYLQLIRSFVDSDVFAYSPELIITTYTILSGEKTFRTWVDANTVKYSDPAVSFFLEDEYVLRPLLLNETRLRYPYEITPFLKFCSALTRGDKNIQNGMPTFVEKLTNANRIMQRLPDDFRDYALTREEENNNWVQLTADLPLFSVITNAKSQVQRGVTHRVVSAATDMLVIPAGTEGNIVDAESHPYIVVWHHQHSTLAYLGQLLSTYPVGSSRLENNTQSRASSESIAEIVGLFADLLHSSLRACDGVCSNDLLEVLGITTEGGYDTAHIILAIFEEEQLHLCQQPSDEASLELLINCTHFLEALIVIAPHRVWPWLARSRLLDADGASTLATILLGTETVLGRYDFLIGCIRLYQALVKDAVERSVFRQTPTKALSRFNAHATSESGASDKVMSNVLYTFGKTLAGIYEGSLNWKFSKVDHRVEINVTICSVFITILKLAYGVDDTPKLDAKLSRSIAPIAEYLTELYLTKLDEKLPMNPILASLVMGVSSDAQTLLTASSARWQQQTKSTLALADTLVRVAILLDRPWTHLEQQLFKATPLLARLYATSDTWKSPVVLLLESLVRGAVRTTRVNESQLADGTDVQKQVEQQEPPSLLGHLGPVTARNFLSVLSLLDEPLRMVDIQTNVWNLLSAVVTCKQQWFSLYLLTGSTPRESIRSKSEKSPDARSKALLSRALDALSNFNFESDDVAWPLHTSMLEFVSSAQNNWSWAMGNLRERKDLIQKLLSFLKWMTKQIKTLRTNVDVLARSYQNRFASLACEVIAMYLHASRQVGDVTPLKDVVPSLAHLETEALALPTYNASLHTYLKTNLNKQYPGVHLTNLKRTMLYPETFGRSFFYDIDLGQQLLGFDGKWAGPREGTGFASDFEKANYNLGLVESQISLLQGWKLLALELSNVVAKDERLVKIIIGVIKQCMTANAESNLPEALFSQLMIVRADLAFALIKKLVETNAQSKEARQLLTPIWAAIRASTPDFEYVFSSEGIHYYRSLLRILYLALHFHLVDDNTPSEDTAFRSSFRGAMPASHNDYVEPISTQLLEILSDIVAKGFRSLANQLHADPASVTPSDFALLTAILQRTIIIPEMDKWQNQAALIFSNSNTVRYATSLFSWSDRLTISHNGVQDPVYGELSLLFLLSLSNIPNLAETMAVEGILSQINTANLMNYYRRPHGMGPFDNPARLHSIWTKGLLPLCLNLLLSVGAPIAAELSSFLNQFPEQLLRATTSLNVSPSSRRPDSKITLSMASEVHSLALLSAILDNVRKEGPRLGIQSNDVSPLDWEKDAIKDDIESWLGRKNALRERIVAIDEKEADMLGKKGAQEGSNELEERVLVELESAGRCLGVGNGNGNGKK